MASLKNALKYLGLVVNGLVDEGCFETMEEIEKQMEKENVLEYIASKYKDKADFSQFIEGGPYSAKEINKFFAQYCGYIEGNKSRKFCVRKNGLCLITALCLEGIFNN